MRDVSPAVIAIPATFGSLAIIMVVLRLIDRIFVHKSSFGWDDGLITIAVVRNDVFFSCFTNIRAADQVLSLP